jgi:hypothetical protein
MSGQGSMSLAATLVLTAVVLVGIAVWLGAVFRAGHQPASRASRRSADPGHSGEAGHGREGSDEP